MAAMVSPQIKVAMDGEIKWEQTSKEASCRDTSSLNSTLGSISLSSCKDYVFVLPDILHRRKQKKQQETMQALIGLELGATDAPVIGLFSWRCPPHTPRTINKAWLRCW